MSMNRLTRPRAHTAVGSAARWRGLLMIEDASHDPHHLARQALIDDQRPHDSTRSQHNDVRTRRSKPGPGHHGAIRAPRFFGLLLLGVRRVLGDQLLHVRSASDAKEPGI